MTVVPSSRAERHALCDLFLSVGPDAPTLCEGWRTADLAAHLVVRERQPLAGPGLVLGGVAAALTARITARAKAAHTYEDLVARVRRGPPPWTAPFDRVINTVEYFVHHEDVRRGGGDRTPRPESGSGVLADDLWDALRRGAKLMTRPLGAAGLDLVRPDGEVLHARAGAPLLTVRGDPGELVLLLSGRGAAAGVEPEGTPEALDALRAASFGL